MPAPAAMPVQPAAPVPANTVPSARRRATQDVMPAADSAPGIQLADDLSNDLLPPPEAPLPSPTRMKPNSAIHLCGLAKPNRR